jgi:hypothetical protein
MVRGAMIAQRDQYMSAAIYHAHPNLESLTAASFDCGGRHHQSHVVGKVSDHN